MNSKNTKSFANGQNWHLKTNKLITEQSYKIPTTSVTLVLSVPKRRFSEYLSVCLQHKDTLHQQ